MTNFDRIKAMSVEEVAEAIYRNDDFDVVIPFCKCKGECDDIIDNNSGPVPKEMCLNCVKEWLESEALK